MKKILLVAAIAVFGMTSVNAQTEQGNWKFGGGSSFSFTSTTSTPEFDGEELDAEEKTSSLNFSVDGNYFIIENLAVGLELAFNSTKYTESEGSNEFEYKTNSFAILPEATYYFRTDNLAPFVGAKVGYMSSGGEEDASKFSGIAFGGEAGVAYFFNSNASIDLSVEYLRSSLANKEEGDYKYKQGVLGVGVGFSVYF